jgi:hypothetical protein
MRRVTIIEEAVAIHKGEGYLHLMKTRFTKEYPEYETQIGKVVPFFH